MLLVNVIFCALSGESATVLSLPTTTNTDTFLFGANLAFSANFFEYWYRGEDP